MKRADRSVRHDGRMQTDPNFQPSETAPTISGVASDQCPECEHDAERPPRKLPTLRSLLRMKPAAERCDEPIYDVGGWPEECPCNHPSHRR